MVLVSEKRKGKVVPILYGNDGREIMEIPKITINGKDYMDIPQRYLNKLDKQPEDTVDGFADQVADRVQNKIEKGFLSTIFRAGAFNELISNRDKEERDRLRDEFDRAYKYQRRR